MLVPLHLCRATGGWKKTSSSVILSHVLFFSNKELTKGIVDLLSLGRKSTSVIHMLGVDLDAQLVQRATEKCAGPTVEFRRLNAVTDVQDRDDLWSGYLAERGRQRFHVAFCFSTTMWVHLNQGDDGLVSLLTCLCRWADNVIIEPQPWKCYRSAARRLRRAGKPPFPHYDSLVHRSSVLDHIDHVMRNQLAMTLHAHLGDSEWNRPVWWYRHVA